MTTWALVLAAGSGTRFGSAKQFVTLGGVPLVERSLEVAREVCDGICLALPPGMEWNGSGVDRAVGGGSTHAESTRLGVARLPDSVDTVLILAPSHPLVTSGLAHRVLDALEPGVDAAAPMLPLTDAPKIVADGIVRSESPGATHVAQLPFAIRRTVLDRAIAWADFAEELEAVAAIGGTIAAVEGDPRNIHVATPEDLAIAARLSTAD